ncbi:TonB-dependent receptor [Phenylobacterium aquaticum]|uniref:TonB-dependent receptor n=1 Tax=Phenylobacterium aquaticum TaxID=1763816 RepID=UPI001F5DC5E9|nr:TonB-dependent receptor [Phenylobacterium aquaticum]MCI3133274.1 TonB-dependent receptor [Phenylobacterium aquaticum]
MRRVKSGVVGYARKRPARLGMLALAGVVSLAGAAQAAEADADANEIAGVQVNGQRKPLDTDTGLSVLPTTVQDTPQAINVISQAQLKAQGVNTLEQALRNVPGITIAIGEGGTLNGDQFKIRGFDAKDDVYIDGLRDFGVYTRDSFNYQEVQVLKGPSGAMFGRGTTGGAINTVSKTPKLDDVTILDAYVGNGDYYRALADINHQLGEHSAVRLNLMGSSTGVVDRDLVKSDRWGAAISVGLGLGTDTSAVLSYLHQHDNRRPDYGIIIVQKPGDIVALPATEYGVGVERSSYLGFKNDVDRTDADVVTLRLSHKPESWLTLTSDSRVGAYKRYFQYTTTDQCNTACTTALFDNNPATEAYGGIGGSGPYDQDSWGAQNISTARMDFTVGGLKNQAIVGLDVSYQHNDKQFYAYTLPSGITARTAIPHALVNPDPNFPAGYTVFRPRPGVNITCPTSGACTTTLNGATVATNVTAATTLSTKGESTDLAVFLTDRLWLTEELSVIGSLRLDRYNAELDTLLMSGAESPVGGLKVKSTLKSPRASVVYEPSQTQTYYLSWGRSETPQGTSVVGAGTAVALTAKDLEPEVSQIWEAGAKLALPSGRASFTASLFDVKKDNALQTDPGTGFLVAQSGERQEVKGLELGLTGKLTDAWTVSAGYAYLDAKIKESYSNCTVPTSTSGTPTAVICPVGVTAAIPVLNTVAVGQQVAYVPKTSASLFTTYDLGRWVPGLSVGGDATYQSKLNVAYTARSVSYADRSTLTAARLAQVPESITLNAFAAWTFADGQRLGLNIYNLTDRLNYTQVFSNRAIPAAGRTFILSYGKTF